MRIAALAASALASLLLATPALAVTVETKISAEFQEKLEDDIGVREASVLSDALTRKITSVFAERGIAAEKVVVTIEGESRYVGRVLATLPHRSGASSPPAEESNMSVGRMASDDEALDDEAPDDDSEYDDEDAGSDDDESEERPRCEGRERAEGRGRRRSSWD